jgi:tRNA(Ile)-lysidine synthase
MTGYRRNFVKKLKKSSTVSQKYFKKKNCVSEDVNKEITAEEFSALLPPFLRQRMAVAVSGGADSLALIFLLQEFYKNREKRLPSEAVFSFDPPIALTVDHKLRADSTQEAWQVQTWMKERGIQHEILTWEHGPLLSGIEEKGREARYRLLCQFCRHHDIPLLLTAHHALDQMETFLMHLARGSGLRGLSGMRALSEHEGITLGRPLLGFSKERLKTTLIKRFQGNFITDPSNASLKIERVRWRQVAPHLASLGLTEKSIGRSVAFLQNVEEQCEKAAHLFIRQAVIEKGETLSFSQNAFQMLLPYVAQTVLLFLFRRLLSSERRVSQALLEQVYAAVIQPNFTGVTAAGCLLRHTLHRTITLSKEVRKNRKTKAAVFLD